MTCRTRVHEQVKNIVLSELRRLSVSKERMSEQLCAPALRARLSLRLGS